MTRIRLPISSTEVESHLKPFFRKFENPQTYFHSNNVSFSVGSLYQLSFNPKNEYIEGNIRIEEIDQENTLLDIVFSRKKIFQTTIAIDIIALIAIGLFLTVFSVLWHFSNPESSFKLFILLMVIINVMQIFITFTTERRFIRGLKKWPSPDPHLVEPSPVFKLIYYSFLAIIMIIAFLLGLSIE